ncbi:hypothetical protein [Haliscomenobacter sp.]|uniref:hypothetical protein n=1 Tax=Haliscomenobacter sp. TaxID=2717303 RepID=UPI003BAC1668
MKKHLSQLTFFAAAFVLCLFGLMQCTQKAAQQTVKETEPTPLVTHAEGADTLRDESITENEVKPIKLKWLNSAGMHGLLDTLDLSDIVASHDWAELGFYGEDRYKIEFYFSKVTKDEKDPFLYHVVGKNRHKKVISEFKGTFRIDSLAQVTDPNLDTEEVGDMGVQRIYSANGKFTLAEDSLKKYSGRFTGKMQMDFGAYDKAPIELWYFSETPNKGSGIRYDGTWTSYKTGKSKPVIWSKDLFRFANDILEEFSIGERDVEINEKYRKLGWDNFWENEEWWAESKKVTM